MKVNFRPKVALELIHIPKPPYFLLLRLPVDNKKKLPACANPHFFQALGDISNGTSLSSVLVLNLVIVRAGQVKAN